MALFLTIDEVQNQ